ncbi:MAG: sulfite exporter TauE/SafE family protein [Pseudomonadota bacterium]
MGPGDFALLLGVGLIGGVWNAVAGGATLFTFPALMVVGLPPVVANATNYLGLLPSNAAAMAAYRSELRALGPSLLPLAVLSGLGAAIGSALLLVSEPETFIALVPALLLIATLLFAFGEPIRRGLLRLAGAARAGSAACTVLFLASIYGGYFGAGLGIILLAIAQVLGHTEFHKANSLKNLLATNFTLISIAIFGVGGLIDWPAAFAMMLGSTAGGYFGGRWARHVNPQILRHLVIGFGLVLSAAYAWQLATDPAL